MPREEFYEIEATPVARQDRAAPRATEMRSPPPSSGERLTRRRQSDNPLEIYSSSIPSNVSYEWKRVSTAGQPATPHLINMRENHWTPVPPDRHPELAVPGETVIQRGDVVLYERPKYLTEEAQLEDIQMGLDPVQRMEEVMYGTDPGHFTRDHPSVKNNSFVKQQFGPGPKPDGDGGLSSEP